MICEKHKIDFNKDGICEKCWFENQTKHMIKKKSNSLITYLKKEGFGNLAALLEIKDIRKVLLKDTRSKKQKIKEKEYK